MVSLKQVLVLSVLAAASLFASVTLTRLGKTRAVGKTISNVSWQDCDGTGNKFFTISSIHIEGDFSQGSVVKFVTSGTTTTAFTHASTDVQVKLGIITVYTGTQDIIPNINFAVGPLHMVGQDSVPTTPPSGNYVTTNRYRDPKKNLIQCVQISYKLS